MNSYIIVYDLRHNERNYMPLYKTIKENYPKYFHLTENSWVIFTDDTAKEISAKIKDKFYYEHFNCDTFLVHKLDDSKDYEGFTATSFYDFLIENRNKEVEE